MSSTPKTMKLLNGNTIVIPYQKTTKETPPSSTVVEPNQQSPQTQTQTQDNNNKMKFKKRDMHAAPASQGVRNKGVELYEEFAKISGDNIPSFKELSQANDPNLIANQFMKFLLQAKSKSGNLYAAGSLPTYFSAWKNALYFEDNFFTNMPKEEFLDQFSGLHQKLSDRAFTRAIKNGEIISKASNHLRRNEAAAVNAWILKNPRQNSDAVGWRDFSILSFLRNAIGRGGEVQGLQWEGTFFNSADQVLDGNWPQQKTSKVSRMVFVHDNDWRLSIFVSLGGYVATKTKRTKSKFIFDDLPKDVSAHVTGVILKKPSGNVPGVLSSNITSHCQRYGSLDDLNASEKLDTVAALVRGGWDMEEFCTGFRYFDLRRQDMQAARVISGHENPNVKVVAPSLKYLNDDDLKMKLIEAADCIYGFIPDSSSPDESLYSLKEVLLSAAIENLAEMQDSLGRGNEYLQKLDNAFRQQGLMWEDMVTIGKQLKLTRMKENERIREQNDLEYMLQKKVVRIEAELQASRAREREKDTLLKELNGKMDSLISLLSAPASSGVTRHAPSVSRDVMPSVSTNETMTEGVSDDNDDDIVMEEEQTCVSSDETAAENVEVNAPSVEASYSPPPKPTHENDAEVSIVSPTTVSPRYGTVAPGKINGVAEIMVGRVKASAPACMTNWRKQSIASLLVEAVNQNVIFSRSPQGNKNPLGLPHHKKSDKVSKNAWQESRGAVKFLASFCENMDEYAFYTGDKRITKNESLSERAKKARNLNI
ncbi:hypothetical protein CTEN210_10292 [Chaetoceros tenuissimus]|uniref:Uncharacterized protein n=1 Tax=Chaetoceros tenuissimus TaxID=426638 RepID=A0AAD3CX34_9STRA|nr:hypothetical protein CTEN210_10292 [Chaetoceros tenuissimus]